MIKLNSLIEQDEELAGHCPNCGTMTTVSYMGDEICPICNQKTVCCSNCYEDCRENGCKKCQEKRTIDANLLYKGGISEQEEEFDEEEFKQCPNCGQFSRPNLMGIEKCPLCHKDVWCCPKCQGEVIEHGCMKCYRDGLLESKLQKNPISTKEREYVKNKFGKVGCSFAKNKNGKYYCYTHRARSKFFDKISDIPKKDVKFISSTS